MLYTAILLDVYFANIHGTIFRILLWPINIWVLEVIEGYILILLYGYNPAWTYYGSDVFFSGNVKLGYFKFWLPMGVFMEFWGWNLLLSVSQSLALGVSPWLVAY